MALDTLRMASLLSVFGALTAAAGMVAGVVVALSNLPFAAWVGALVAFGGLYAAVLLLGFAANLRVLHRIEQSLGTGRGESSPRKRTK